MKKIFIISVVAIMLAGLAANANSALPGKVSHIVTGGPIIYFKIEGATHIGCASERRFVVNTSTPFGKNAYAMLLSAYYTSAKVGVVSANTCGTSTDSEDVLHTYLE